MHDRGGWFRSVSEGCNRHTGRLLEFQTRKNDSPSTGQCPIASFPPLLDRWRQGRRDFDNSSLLSFCCRRTFSPALFHARSLEGVARVRTKAPVVNAIVDLDHERCFTAADVCSRSWLRRPLLLIFLALFSSGSPSPLLQSPIHLTHPNPARSEYLIDRSLHHVRQLSGC